MFRALACLLILFATVLVPRPNAQTITVSGDGAAQTITVIDNLTVGPLPGQQLQTLIPNRGKPAVGRSTIRGRVLTTDGQSLRRASVTITAPELGTPRSALTDSDGRYEFASLPAGRYAITGSKTAFVNWGYGQTQPNSPARPLVLADNQTADGIDLRLPRGGVITGRITDDLGDAVVGASVTLMRQTFVQGQRRFTPPTDEARQTISASTGSLALRQVSTSFPRRPHR